MLCDLILLIEIIMGPHERTEFMCVDHGMSNLGNGWVMDTRVFYSCTLIINNQRGICSPPKKNQSNKNQEKRRGRKLRKLKGHFVILT